MIAAIDPTTTTPAAPPVSTPAAPAGRTKQDLLRTVSASRLGTWLQCRLKFYFRYLAGITKPNTAARHTGTVVHAVLQQWNLARWRRTSLDSDTVRAVFEQAWVLPEDESIVWAEDEPEAAAKAEALALVEMYLRESPIPVDERPEAVEVTVERDLASHGLPILVGVLDLVRAGGRIVDFKTSGKTPNAGMALHTNEAQLTAYSLLYREATDRRESARELHHLVKTKTPKLVVVEDGPATDTQTTRFLRQVESYVRGVESEDFVPSPGFGCAACEFFRECRLWS
ncbi:MAG: PD-(D/E)XK nuclease family protein [Chthoniobacter sp.]|uniref:RecB family exonuclease n=1 Tax=Chthoniobacter sp. TaxID=2510640 RepID=UPI0032A994E5